MCGIAGFAGIFDRTTEACSTGHQPMAIEDGPVRIAYMAARVPVVSTRVGAEGLDVSSPEHILLADTAGEFAESCLALLDDAAERRRMAGSAWELVSSRFCWSAVVGMFEETIGAGVAHR